MRAAAAAAAAAGSFESGVLEPMGLRSGLLSRSAVARDEGDLERRSKREGRFGSVWSNLERLRGSSAISDQGKKIINRVKLKSVESTVKVNRKIKLSRVGARAEKVMCLMKVK